MSSCPFLADFGNGVAPSTHVDLRRRLLRLHFSPHLSLSPFLHLTGHLQSDMGANYHGGCMRDVHPLLEAAMFRDRFFLYAVRKQAFCAWDGDSLMEIILGDQIKRLHGRI